MDIEFNTFGKNLLEYFVKQFNGNKKKNPNDNYIKLVMANDFFSAPEAIAPLAGIIDYLKALGYKVYVKYGSNVLRSSGLNAPFLVDKNQYELLSPMYKVWRYNSPEEVFQIVSALVAFLNHRVECAPGVLQAFEWTVNEVMDNVIQHSQSEYGYVVCTATSGAHISVAIYDNGIGIMKSFKNSKYRFRSATDAIMAAMQEKTTSDPEKGQGNGLWGMSKLIKNNKGSLSILSSSASVMIDKYNNIEKKDRSVTLKTDTPFTIGTLVDFQFQCNNAVSIQDVFGVDYDFTNLTLEALEDESNRIHIKIKDFSFGYATRQAGSSARIMAINYVTQSNMKQQIIIDFEGVGIVASSFADEYLGKLVQHFGFVVFNNLFKIINIGKENMAIVNRSIMQRNSQ